MKVTGYGPHATPERVAQIEALMRTMGGAVEMLAALLPPGGCVLFGLREHVDVVAPLPPGLAAASGPQRHRLVPLPRTDLAAALRALGREECALKVEGGPRDEPQPEGAALLVAALEDVVAVTWSHARRVAPRTNARGGRA